MIPKTIHYCWFGGNPKPELAKKCIRSWKKRCPNYEIVEWNESNYDISAAPHYVRQAYEVGKWAFVTDYVRLHVVYEHGGIYLDTDVELKKNLDSLLPYDAYFGFEDGKHIATGLGFGAVKNAPILKELMDDYQNIPFILQDGTHDTLTCPQRNTQVFLQHGLIQDDSTQILDDKILILSSSYLCPMSYTGGEIRKSKDTISIHWFSASWKTAEQKARISAYRKSQKKLQRKAVLHNIKCLPNRIIKGVLGDIRYEQLKKKLKRGK